MTDPRDIADSEALRSLSDAALAVALDLRSEERLALHRLSIFRSRIQTRALLRDSGKLSRKH